MTYEYVCIACQHAWEEEQRISAAPLTTCPQCHQETAKRQVSGGAGFILKGSGWYADLYSSAKPGSGNSESKKESGAESKKESSTESKKSTESSSSSSTPASSSSSDSSTSTSTSSKATATAT